METKVCTICKKELEATTDNFYKVLNRLKPCCKICFNNLGKERYKENAEKIKMRHKKYYKENAEKIKMRHKKYYKENTEKIKLRNQKYVKENPEKVKKILSNWYKKNSCKVKKSGAKWYEENRDRVLKQRRKHSKKKVKELSDSYVANCMRLSVKDLTPETVKTKRLIIKIRRELKQM